VPATGRSLGGMLTQQLQGLFAFRFPGLDSKDQRRPHPSTCCVVF
jgi:hypothetical protein